MKTLIRLGSIILLFAGNIQTLFAQGLERIIVEKYYISGKEDIAKEGGILPVGSVTYRIYADMLPGYKFQAAFGIPGHELRLATTTSFFNNEDRGSYIPTVIPYRNIDQNTIMLDSWLTAGAACEGHWGVLKSEDDTVTTIVNRDHILQNDNKEAGIPLKERDGLFIGLAPRVTFFGIDSMAISMFNNRNDKNIQNTFSTENGSWAVLGGTNGPTPENRVLIAQMTTDGVFSFELNIQIGSADGKSFKRYVAKNPTSDELQIESLIYNSSSKH